MTSSTEAEQPVPLDRIKRSNSLDAGGAVLRALARSPHYNENLHQLDETQPVPPLDLDAPAHPSWYEFWVVKWEVPRKLFHCITGFVVLGLYVFKLDVNAVVRILFYMFLVIASADVLRLNSPAFERFYESVLGILMRSGEKERVNGVIWYLVGVMVSLRLFPEDIAAVSIIILSWCDPCASTFGRLFGKRTPALPAPFFARRKSLAGFIAASLMGMLVSYMFWGTSIARIGERSTGLSWEPNGVATFGTKRVPGALRTGWRGIHHGFAVSDVSMSSRLREFSSRNAPAIPPLVMYISCGLIAGFTEALEMGGLDDNISIPILSGFLIWGMLWVWGWIVTA
ncbi:Diacylglycerol kinase [Malassezia pachydermatis]|uniref:Hsd1-er membrane protein n=1 Tax=Malassezia pachydermatis TaxID=77020 RepID=A0A0M8MSQ5_9BASI|nr:hsd1-er membrane protein [Malassezia pachydermatis]KOS13030.1 hsd1-er membrane protein [Malassezia pachydermatis]